MHLLEQLYTIVYNRVIEYRIEFYRTEAGNEPFTDWLASLKDIDTKALIFQRLQRVKLGNFGDCDSIDDGLWEFCIHAGPGFRIYCAIIGKQVILVTGGGIKRTQKRDIKQALMYLEEYRRTKK